MSPFEVLARVSVLEGVAGVKPGTWSRRPDGLRLAVAALSPSARWAGDDRDVLVAALRDAVSVLSREDGEDVVQDVLGGVSLNQSYGELYAVGVAIAKRGEVDLKLARQYLWRHARHRAVSLERREVGIRVDVEEALQVEAPVAREATVDGLICKLEPALYAAVGERLRTRFRAARQLSLLPILDAVLADKDKSAVQVARDLGHPEWVDGTGAATRVSMVRREVRAELARVVAGEWSVAA